MNQNQEYPYENNCGLCDKLTNETSANPADWPIRLQYPGGEDKTMTYCKGCVCNEMSYVFEQKMISRPGDTLAEWLEDKGMDTFALAKKIEALGSQWQQAYPAPHVQALVGGLFTGETPIRAMMAEALQETTGIPAEFWMNREKSYRMKLEEINKRHNKD